MSLRIQPGSTAFDAGLELDPAPIEGLSAKNETSGGLVDADRYDGLLARSGQEALPCRTAETAPISKGLAERERRGFAVIDLGSSSAKMLVLRRTAGGAWETALDVKIQTELGLGTSPGQPLPVAGKTKALEAVGAFLEKAKQLGIPAGEVHLMATAAVRNSSDGPAFADQLQKDFELGSVRVLSGEQEAEMGYLGAIAAFTADASSASSTSSPPRFATLDLGGSSFQLAVGSDTAMERGASTQVGSNLIQSELLPAGIIADADFAKADAALREAGGKHEAKLPLEPALLSGRQVVATGGVSKFLRRHFGKDVIARADIDALRKQLGAMDVAARGPFLQQGKDDATRAALGIDTDKGAEGYGKKLPASITLLLRIMDGIGIDELRVSETDNRHALISKVRREASASQDPVGKLPAKSCVV